MHTPRLALAMAAIVLCAAAPAPAQQALAADSTSRGYFASWFARVTKTQAEQPHWITPLATVTPRLEEEFRYDMDRLMDANGSTAENYGGGKGLELIPAERVEVLVNLPPYVVHQTAAAPPGFGDFSFTLKYRLAAANEANGNYILTVFFGATLPTGSRSIGSRAAVITPTIAYGKGFGKFDAQGTIGASLPASDTALMGRAVLWNNAFQYQIVHKLWPELEVNATFFQGGPNDGRRQAFLTPGIVIGKIHLAGRLGLTFGGGFQIAATRFHLTNHNAILSVRFPF